MTQSPAFRGSMPGQHVTGLSVPEPVLAGQGGAAPSEQSSPAPRSADSYPAQPYPAQPIPAQPIPATPSRAEYYSAQSYSDGSNSARPYPAQAYPAQPHPATPYPAQSFSAQPRPATPYPAQSYPAQSWAAQSYPGQPQSAQSRPAQVYPAHSQPTPSYSGQPYPTNQAYSGQPQARPDLSGPAYSAQSYTTFPNSAHSYPGQSYPPQPPAFPGRPPARYPTPPPTPAPRRRHGRRVALVLGLLAVAGIAVAAFVIRPAEPVRASDTGAIAEPGTLSVFQLQPGDCYNSTQAPPPPGQTQPISVVQAVQCTAPHTNQVVAKISYSPTEISSGIPESRADADCTTQFQGKLDPAALTDPTLKPGRLAPADAATWSRTPVVACVMFSEQPITRSLLR